MATVHNFEDALARQRDGIKQALMELVMVYGGEEYSGLKNTWKHRLCVQKFNLPIKPLMWITCEGSELTFESNGNYVLPFEFYNTDQMACLYDKLVAQINAVLTKTEK